MCTTGAKRIDPSVVVRRRFEVFVDEQLAYEFVSAGIGVQDDFGCKVPKSTLIKTLAGVHPPDRGEYLVDGRRIHFSRHAMRSISASPPSTRTWRSSR